MRWAERSRRASSSAPGHGLFGIVQGGVHADLRQRSAARLIEIGFDGYAVGGLAVGEGQAAMFAMLDATVPALPDDRPRYLMGVGKPADLVGAVQRGIDMFDCVLPTRSGRTGQAFTRAGTLNLRNARHADDPRRSTRMRLRRPARGFSRAYLHHLARSGEILGAMLLTEHNLRYYADLMAAMRAAIETGPGGFCRRFRRGAAAVAGRRRAMSDQPALAQLGRQAALPASPDEAVLETRAEPASGRLYLVRFTCPEFTSLCPVTGQPDFAHLVIDYVPAALGSREQVAEALSGLLPQSRGVPRGLHAGDRPAAGRRPRAAVAAHRRLLVSARRHADRRLLPDRRAAGRALAARSGRGTLSRPRLSPSDDRADPRGDPRPRLAPRASMRSASPRRRLDAEARTGLREFIARGYHGDMGWLAGTAARRGDPQHACGPRRAPSSCSASIMRPRRIRWRLHDARDRGAVSVYARGRDYHDTLKRRLKGARALDRASAGRAR